MNSELARRYDLVCKTPSDIVEHLPVFVDTVKELNATKVVELGVRYGISTIAWLYALEGQGHLWSVDCSFPIAGPEIDFNLLDPQGPLGVQRHWSFILGYDDWDEVLNALPKYDVDILFIDTQHTYEQTHLELELYHTRVRKGGRILLHDTAIETTGNATTPQPPYPVRTAAEEFCEINGYEFQNRTNCFGLGTIYIP